MFFKNKFSINIENVFCLLAIVFAGISIADKIFYINTEFNYEELFTALTARHDIPTGFIFKNFLIVDVHPPLYNVFMYLWQYLFPSISEASLRLPSILFYGGSLLACFCCFPHKYPKIVKYLFICFISASAPLSFYGWEARPYSLMFALAIPVTFFTLFLAEQVQNTAGVGWKQHASFFILLLTLAYTHYFGALFAGLCALFLVYISLRVKKDIKPFLLTLIVLMAAVFIWAGPNLYLNYIAKRFNGNWWNGGESNAILFLEDWVNFLFTFKGKYIIAALTALGIIYVYKNKEYKNSLLEYQTEILFFAFSSFFMFFTVALVGLRINLLIERYFISLLVPVFLMLSIVFGLFISRYAKASVLLLLFFILNISYPGYNKLFFCSKGVAQYIKDSGVKEIKVTALEYYPRPSIPYMYGFYLNYKMKAGVEVKDLFYNPGLPVEQGELIWLPNCADIRKHAVISKKLGYCVRPQIYIGEDSCLMVKDPKGCSPMFSIPLGDTGLHNPSGGLSWLK